MAARPTHSFARKTVVLYLAGMVWYGDIAHQVATLLTHAQPEVQIACQMDVLCARSYIKSHSVSELDTESPHRTCCSGLYDAVTVDCFVRRC